MERNDRDSMRQAIVKLFREYPLLKGKAVIIGGAAVMLRLENTVVMENIRPTVDIDLVALHDVDIEQVKEKVPSYNVDVLIVDYLKGSAGPLEPEVVAMAFADRDELDVEGVAVPVVGPIGLLATKLSRSGEEGREYYRGQDLADIINVWLAEPDTVIERWVRFAGMPGVKRAVDGFRNLLKDDYSEGTRAVAREMDFDIGDMDFIFLKARLDDLLDKLK
jgi:hypothetical protein